MNKYSKKKNIWNTTYNLQTGPISAVLGAVVLAVFYAIGAVVYHISKFSILNWMFEEGYMGFLDNILTGFILVVCTIIIILSFWCIIIEPILKQFAIARYCRLPLTEEEIKLGIETGDFSSFSMRLFNSPQCFTIASSHKLKSCCIRCRTLGLSNIPSKSFMSGSVFTRS